MALLVNIAGTDRTDQIAWPSFVKTENLTAQVDTLEFKIRNYGTKNFVPEILDEVIVYNGAEKIFGGNIIEINEEVEAGKLFTRTIKCKDYTHLFDRYLVVEAYESDTVKNIIDDLVANYAPGFTTTNVNCSLNVGYIAFNYEQPSKCLQQLAELFNYDFYIDYDKDIHFFSKEENLAPFDLDDTGGNFVFNSLKINRKANQMRNTIYVRGGEYEGDSYTEEIIADGTALIYKFGYKYSGYTIEVDGTPKTVGLDFISNPDDYDCLYNYQEKAVKFKPATLPPATKKVSITGNPKIPVIIKIRDNSSVAEFGEYEFVIIDTRINSKEGARQRAKSELYAYANSISEGSFITYTDGLRVGQKIRLNSSIWGYNEIFIINKLGVKVHNPGDGTLEYTASLLTTRTFGIIDTLQKLLTQENKNIKISADEVLDKIETVQEEIKIEESITRYQTKLLNEEIEIPESIRRDPWTAQWVLGPWTPADEDDPKRPIKLDRASATLY